MASVSLERVRKVYPDGTEAVREVSLEIGDGELLVLVGPSGCGKSTLLRVIAGLEPVTAGTVRIGDQVVTGLPAPERDVAMVFQSYALYPHMSVFDNIAFGLLMRRVPRAEIRRRVEEAAATLGLAEVLGKKPRELSGGQRQRVALGRAVVRAPRVFLLDEPLSNLDATLRVQMRVELARLQRQLGVTTVYVTHDQSEALTLGDRVAVLAGGIVQQIAPPQVLYEEPANLFVAEFIGSPGMNLVRAQLAGEAGREVRIGPHRLGIPGELLAHRPALVRYGGQDVVLGIRPEHLSEADATTEPTRCLPAEVDVLEHLGAEILAHCTVEAGPGTAKAGVSGARAPGRTVLTARLEVQTDAREGRPLTLAVDTARMHFFDPQSGRRLG